MDERAVTTRRVMKSVARYGRLTPLPVVDAQGQSPIVVALQNDLISVIVEKTEKFGGRANVFVPHNDSLALVDFTVNDSVTEPHAQKGHANMTVGMFIAFLEMQGGHGSVNVPSSSEVEVSNLRTVAYAF